MNPSVSELARQIDHSLLQPYLTDAAVRAGCAFAREKRVASVCVKPCDVPLARECLAGSDVPVCAVIGFPHGNSTTGIKVIEAESAVLAGAREIDMVVNTGKVKSGEWGFVEREISLVNQAVIGAGGLLKVIFENDFLEEAEIIRLCTLCSRVGVAFVKTSTGYGFVPQEGGGMATVGATPEHIELMRAHTAPEIEIKASGGIRTLDDLLALRACGATRFGASATASILQEATDRGFPATPIGR